MFDRWSCCVSVFRMFEPRLNSISNELDDSDLIHEIIPEDETSIDMLSHMNVRTTIHWAPVVEGDFNSKEHINTDAEHFDALFARSNGSSPPSHPRCYSSGSPSTAPSLLTADPTTQIYAQSQPLLSTSSSPSKLKQSSEIIADVPSQQSTVSSSSSSSLKTSSSSARAKRKNFSLTHAAQTFLQASNGQNEQLEPLARSCSYKRPQSIKKYRQKKKEKEREKEKEKEQQQTHYLSSHQYSTMATSPNTHTSSSATTDSSRKSIVATTTVVARISAADLMTVDDAQDQWSSLQAQRSGRIGKIDSTEIFVFILCLSRVMLNCTSCRSQSLAGIEEEVHAAADDDDAEKEKEKEKRRN
jgi:hypothetical protein